MRGDCGGGLVFHRLVLEEIKVIDVTTAPALVNKSDNYLIPI